MFKSVGSRMIRRDRAIVGEVQMSADWTPSAATVNTLPAKVTAYDTVIADTGITWDNVNKRFIPKVPGYYWISHKIYAANTTWGGGQGNSRILKNGNTSPVDLSGAVNAGLTINGSLGFAYFNGSTDYAEIYYYCTATTPVFGSLWTSPFRMALIK